MVMVHKNDSSERTLVLTSWFGMISVQQEEKHFYIYQLFNEQIALSLNK